MNWEGLKKLFETYPLPWSVGGNGEDDSIISSAGRGWTTRGFVQAINTAAKPEPPFVPGLYPYRRADGSVHALWLYSRQDMIDFARRSLGQMGKRIEPEFPE